MTAEPPFPVMKRAGMRREGHLRESERVKGEWTDELIHAALSDDRRGQDRCPAARTP